jgi:hypothetical protein
MLALFQAEMVHPRLHNEDLRGREVTGVLHTRRRRALPECERGMAGRLTSLPPNENSALFPSKSRSSPGYLYEILRNSIREEPVDENLNVQVTSGRAFRRRLSPVTFNVIQKDDSGVCLLMEIW